MSAEKLKLFDDFAEQITPQLQVLKKAYLDEFGNKEHLANANQKLLLKHEITIKDLESTKTVNKNQQNQLKQLQAKIKQLEDENTDMNDGNVKLALENKSLQEEISTVKTDKTQLAFRLNKIEVLNEQEKKKSSEIISSLTREKNSLIEKVASLEEKRQQSKEKDEKMEKTSKG